MHQPPIPSISGDVPCVILNCIICHTDPVQLTNTQRMAGPDCAGDLLFTQYAVGKTEEVNL